jgi:hypothetical protein
MMTTVQTHHTLTYRGGVGTRTAEAPAHYAAAVVPHTAVVVPYAAVVVPYAAVVPHPVSTHPVSPFRFAVAATPSFPHLSIDLEAALGST